MELKKKMIHMDGAEAHTKMQIALEEDVNISDVKPDVRQLLTDHGQILIDEVRVMTDQVNVKGRLVYEVLYLTDGSQVPVSCMRGEIPFSEQVALDKTAVGDTVFADGEVEDLTVMMINSRKLSIESVLSIAISRVGTVEKEAVVGLQGDETLEYRHKTYHFMDDVLHKKDIFRFKEDIAIPPDCYNIGELIWYKICYCGMDFHAADEKIVIQGERKAFFLYLGENGELQWFESNQPITGSFFCDGCEEGMEPNISYHVSNMTVEPKNDADGELRAFYADTVLELDICLQKEEELQLLSDVYGVDQEIETVAETINVHKILHTVSAKQRVAKKMSLENEKSKADQILCCDVTLTVEENHFSENGLEIYGMAQVFVLYLTSGKTAYPEAVREKIPISFTVNCPEEVKNGEAKPSVQIQLEPEQFAVVRSDPSTLECKMTVCVKARIDGTEEIPVITGLQVNDIDTGKMNELPAMCIWVAEEGDSLWKIGKQFYVPVEKIKKMNELHGDELVPGQKLLVVR